jgi:hypothetical protein
LDDSRSKRQPPASGGLPLFAGVTLDGVRESVAMGVGLTVVDEQPVPVPE